MICFQFCKAVLLVVEFVLFTLEHRDDANGSLKEKLINRINHPSDDVRMM